MAHRVPTALAAAGGDCDRMIDSGPGDRGPDGEPQPNALISRVLPCTVPEPGNGGQRIRGLPSIVARRAESLVFLDLAEVWAFEVADRLTSVHSTRGRFDVDASLAELEAFLGGRLMRVHRNWLVDLMQVKELRYSEGQATLLVGFCLGVDSRGLEVPVARSRLHLTRSALLMHSVGLRRTRRPKAPNHHLSREDRTGAP